MRDLSYVKSNTGTVRVGDLVTYSDDLFSGNILWMVSSIKQTDYVEDPIVALSYCEGYLSDSALKLLKIQNLLLVTSNQVKFLNKRKAA